jgi:hypothetical protein
MFIFHTFTSGKLQDFRALAGTYVPMQRQKYNLLVTENAVSMYKSAKYFQKQQQVSAGVILYNRVSAFVGSLAKPDHLF